MNQFGKFAEKIGILVQGGTVNVGQIRLDSEMSRQELRNRKALLNNVRNAWVEGVLEKSLHEQIPIVLGLENRPSAVASPWNMDIINPDKSCQPLPAGTPVIDVFDKLGEGGTLLILGEPGSGKTITLLQLARDLIARAEKDMEHRIPVVLNLSSWVAEKQTIAEWIVEELNSKYQVNRKIGAQWVKKQELLLLLDGLDEIRDLEKRNACVTALNAFQQEQSTEMVVCCRMKDYEELGDRLKLQTALVLQPLTNEQIQAYLERLQSNLTILKTLLIEDVTLQELAHSPLLLNIMVFAYQGIEVADISESIDRKKQLFDDYINRIFQGSRPKGYLQNLQYRENQQYSREEATRWLIWLAQNMILYSATIFLIEKIQPYLINSEEINFYFIRTSKEQNCIIEGTETNFYKVASGLINGLVHGLVFGIPTGAIFEILFNANGMYIGLIVAISRIIVNVVLFWKIKSFIVPKECIAWSWEVFKEKNKVIVILITSFIFGVITSYLYGIILGIISGALGGMTVSLRFGLVQSEVVEKVYPNQGIRESVFNALFFGIIFGLMTAIGFGLISYKLIDGLNDGISDGLILGVVLGVCTFLNTGLSFGGLTCIQHYVLRLILYFTRRIPWNYAKFLDWASDKLFLQKVGGGYIFIHRSLMEHFAEMEKN